MSSLRARLVAREGSGNGRSLALSALGCALRNASRARRLGRYFAPGRKATQMSDLQGIFRIACLARTSVEVPLSGCAANEKNIAHRRAAGAREKRALAASN